MRFTLWLRKPIAPEEWERAAEEVTGEKNLLLIEGSGRIEEGYLEGEELFLSIDAHNGTDAISLSIPLSELGEPLLLDLTKALLNRFLNHFLNSKV
ncbi:MAG: hypothetical protein QXG32_00700 [Candidatus Bathyarchaeia archaeon]